MKKLSKALILSSLVLSSCVNLKEDVPEKPESEFNTNPGLNKRAVLNFNLQEAEKRLIDLADKAFEEEAWLFLPNKNRWYEIAKNEKTVVDFDGEEIPSIVQQSELDVNYIREKKREKLVVYHIHPSGNGLKRKLENLIENPSIGIKNPKDYVNRTIKLSLELSTLPSMEDLENCVKLTRHMRRHRPNSDISFAIASPLGISRYWVIEDRISKLVDMRILELYDLCQEIKKEHIEKRDSIIKTDPEHKYRKSYTLQDTLEVEFIPKEDIFRN